MPYRRKPLVTEQYYHVFNRGIDGMQIYKDSRDYKRFIDLLDFYRFLNPPVRFSYYNEMSLQKKAEVRKSLQDNYDKQVDILCFCIMPNHYHLLLNQLSDKGISDFIRIVQNAYARYFNIKYHRKGRLVQSEFLYELMETDDQLDHVSRYIHLNPYTAHMLNIDRLGSYKMSSFQEYIGRREYEFVATDYLLSRFNGSEEYKEFVLDRAEYQRQLGRIKHLLIEPSV